MMKSAHSALLLLSHRRLLFRVAKSELKARYAGSVFGASWAVLTPLMVLGANALVYSVFLRVRVPGRSGLEYILLLFAGLVPYMMTSESIAQGLGSVATTKSVWANTVFPVDLAPPKAVILSQFSMFVGSTGVLIATIATQGFHLSMLLFPVIWLLHVMALTGITWMLSLVALVFRDLQNMVSLFMLLLMVSSPIAYSPEMVPERYRLVMILNPLAWFVRAYQDVVVLGRLPGPAHVAVLLAISLGLFFGGGYFFSRVKPVMLDYV